MTIIYNMILEDYVRYKKIESAMIKELKTIPEGWVCKRKHNESYYFSYQYRKDNIKHNTTISYEEAEKLLISTKKRGLIVKQLKQIDGYSTYIEKAYPNIIDEYNSYINNKSDEKKEIKKSNNFYGNNKIYRTLKGDEVRSKSEAIIANALYTNDIEYAYEKKLSIGWYDFLPDFTVRNRNNNQNYYWEHCGMMSDVKYVEKWKWKKSVYEQNEIVEWKNLIVTYEYDNKVIDSKEIQKIIDLCLK